MPEFCAVCNHDRRDHFDDHGCTAEVSRLRASQGIFRKPAWRWGPCPCTTYLPEETP